MWRRDAKAELSDVANAELLEFLDRESPSAHSDVGTELVKSAEPLGDYQVLCPNPQACKYVVLSTKRRAFALAHGMNAISYKLNRELKARALQCGAQDFPKAGVDWATFILFRADWPRHDLEFWTRKAYSLARNPG